MLKKLNDINAIRPEYDKLFKQSLIHDEGTGTLEEIMHVTAQFAGSDGSALKSRLLSKNQHIRTDDTSSNRAGQAHRFQSG